MNDIRYKTSNFNINNDDLLWEKFMYFVRLLIPYESHWSRLTVKQIIPVIAFIYESEVMGEGHIGFLDLHREYIGVSDVINALKAIGVSVEYIDNLRGIPNNYLLPDDLYAQCNNEEDFECKMDELDATFEPVDSVFYELGNYEINDKILKYVRENLKEFFVTS